MTVRVAPRGASALLGALLLVTGLAPLAPAAIVAAAAPPSAPTGLSPSSGATVYANPVLSWSAVSGAARYRVQVSTAPDFSVITYAVDTQELRATPPTDLPLGTLYWRVAGMDGSSLLGPWADTQFNKVWAAAPTPQYPPNLATLTFPTDALRFTWSALAGAASYELQVDDASDFIGATTYTTKNTSYVITEPKTSGQAFYWRVRGDSAASGVVSNWSVTFTATVNWPGTPTLVYPADHANIATAAGDLYFDWDPVLGAKTYELQVSPNADWTNNRTIDVTIKDTRYAPPTTLNNGNYYWRVRALDAANAQNFGPWSDASVVALVFERSWGTRPTLLAPTNGNNTVSVPTFTWTPIDHAAWYQLEVSTDINFATGPNTKDCYTNRTTFTPYLSGVGTGIIPPGSCSVFPQPGVTYYWHVRGIDAPVLNPGIEYSAGVLGLWSNTSNSNVYSFVYTPNVPAYVSPANSHTVEVPTLQWADAPGATRYHVTILKSNGTTAATADTYSDSWTPTSLLNVSDSPFRWYVQAYDQNNQLSLIPLQANQRTFSLTAISTTYATADPVSPAAGTGSFDMPSLAWHPVTGAVTYQVIWGVQGSGVEHLDWPRTAYPAFTYPTSVFSSGTYFWYVRAYDGSNIEIPSSAGSQRTFVISQLDLLAPSDYLTPSKCATPPSCTPVPDTATLTWNAVPGAFTYTVYVALDPNFTNIYRQYTTTFTRLAPRDSWLDNQANQAYYWFVRPSRSNNSGRFDSLAQENASAYQKRSEGIHLIAPADAASVANEVTFSWQDFLASNQALSAPVTQEAKQYHIQVSTVADFATIFDDKVVDQTFFTEYDRTYPEGPLYWRVQAIDGSGNYLTWSAVRTLTKSSPAVSLAYPVAGATVTGVPYLQWTTQSFAATYDVQIAKNGDVNFSSSNQVTLTNTKMSAYAYTEALAAGDYAWRVRREDADGRAGPWSAARVFHLVPTAPSLVGPANGALVGAAAQPTFLFQWSSAQPYPKYIVETSTASSFASLTETRSTIMTSWAPVAFYGAGTYYWRVKSLNAAGTVVATSAVWTFTIGTVVPPSTGATHHALTPTRLLDTRDGTGGMAILKSHVAQGFTVTGGVVPTSAIAVTGNLTVTGQTSLGFLYIGPVSMNNPTSSTLNFPLNDDRANAVTVALGTGGKLYVTYAAPTTGPTAQAIFDVTGYFTPDMTGATYHALTPTRLLDTRDGTGGMAILKSHVAQGFTVTGGVVPTSAIAVTGNLTVTGQTSRGFLYIGPVSMNNPTSSTLNFPLNDDRANAVTVALGTGGKLYVTYAAPTTGPTAQAIFDVTGYFTPDMTGATYHALTPTRLLDTRDGTGGMAILKSHVAQGFTVTGGVVPTSAIAVTGNLTVTGQTSLGFLYIGPVSMNNPTSSTLNFPLNDDRANAVTVALGTGGKLYVTYAAPTTGPTAQAIFDVTGYFTP